MLFDCAQCGEALVLPVGEQVRASVQCAPGPVQGIGGAATVPVQFLLDPSAAPVEGVPGEAGDVDEFVAAYTAAERVESERWKPFTYDEIVARDKANLDITWLKDDSLEDLDNLPSPDVIAREIVEDLTAALAEFEAVATALEEQLRS